MRKPLLGVFQIPEETKYELEVVLNDFNEDRPSRYRLTFSILYRALVDRFLGDPDFRKDLLTTIKETQIAVPILMCPHPGCNSTSGFYLYDPPYGIRCNKCTRVFVIPKEYRDYMTSLKHLELAKSKLTKVADFEELEELKCKRCGATESELEIPELTDHARLIRQAIIKCKKCGYTSNEMSKLLVRDRLKNAKLKARQKLRILKKVDPKEEDSNKEVI